MMKHNTKYILLASVLSLVAATACQRDELTDRTPVGEDILKFSVGFAGSGEIVLSKGATLASEDGTVSIPLTCSVTDGIEVNLPDAAVARKSASLTKGTQINSEAEFLGEDLTSFTAAGWNADKTEFVPSGTAVKYSGGKWKTDATYRWRGSDSKTFLAYANLPSSGATVTNYVTPSVKQTFSYTVPTDAREQNDIMLGWYEGNGGGTSTAAITMVHPLTAVVFKKGEINPSVTAIKSISIEGVYTSGAADVTYALSGSDIVPTYDWGSTRTGSQTVTLGPAEGATELEVASDGKIGTSFIVLPQEVAAGALKLMITVVNNGEDAVLAASIPAGTWEEGKTNTYTLGYEGKEFHLEVSGSVSMDCRGLTGTDKVNVKSYVTSGLTDSPVKWRMEYWDDATSSWTETKPASYDWIAFDITSGSGSVDGVDLTADVRYSEGELTVTENVEFTSNDNLRSAASKGTEDEPFDLSMYDIDGNANASGAVTANCYVVRSSGWYAIPLVYGNAIKDGAVNTNAFSPTKPSGASNFLTPFLNSKSAGITSPYIDTDLGVSDISTWKAFPLWEDVPNSAIIDDDARKCYIINRTEAGKRGLTVDAAYLVFYVNRMTLTQGNVVLAASNENGIVWSWHLWVTDNDLQCLNVTNYSGVINNMMPVNLGWAVTGTANTTVNFPGRSGKVRIAQPRGALTVYSDEITVERLSRVETNVSYGNSSPYYQWGRKDPFIRSDQSSATNKNKEIPSDRYTVHSGYSVLTADNAKTPEMKYPSNMYTDRDIYHAYRNRWNALETGTGKGAVAYQNKPVKTIYDPCPPGFVAPHPGAFDGFRANGEKLDFLEDNVDFSVSRKSTFELYTSKAKTESISIPACGYRGSGLSSEEETAYYWTAVLFNDGGGGFFRIRTGGLSLKGGSYVNGFAVRPMAE